MNCHWEIVPGPRVWVIGGYHVHVPSPHSYSFVLAIVPGLKTDAVYILFSSLVVQLLLGTICVPGKHIFIF